MSKLSKKEYGQALLKLQLDLVNLQRWVRSNGTKVLVLFEGRAAGKGHFLNQINDQQLTPDNPVLPPFQENIHNTSLPNKLIIPQIY